MSKDGITTIYSIGAFLIGIVTFAGIWLYALSSWGLLFGLIFGWIPALIGAFVLAFIWPLAALLLIVFFMLAR